MPLTISQFAKLLNLSPSTISKAINGYTDVSQETRERVSIAIKEYGYQPIASARSLRLKKSNRIGVVNPTSTLANDFFIRILKGCTIQAEELGYNLVLYTAAVDQPDLILRACISKDIDGLLIMGSGKVENILERISQTGIPFMLVGRETKIENIPFISPDNEDGVYQAITHLITQGKKEIAFIGQMDDPITHESRFSGYLKAMREHQLDVRQEWIVSASSTYPGGYYAMKEILQLPNRPDAIFCFSDGVAIESLSALAEFGVRVPQDIALVSCDNIPVSQSTQPPLTTINIPLEEIGKLATRNLINKIADQLFEIPRQIVPVDLVLRESSVSSR